MKFVVRSRVCQGAPLRSLLAMLLGVGLLLFCGMMNNRAWANESPSLKITIVDEGLYRLSYNDLVDAGFALNSVDPRLLRLENQGQELAILIEGEADALFDPSDQILFYATAIDSKFTERNVYWLSIGNQLGRRMGVSSVAATQGLPVATHFPATHHAEEQTTYWHNMPGKDDERWFWDARLSPNTEEMPTSRAYTFDLQNVSRDATATVEVRLKGYTSLAHRTRITLNDIPIDDQTWAGQGQFSHVAEIAQAFLQSGENTLVVEAINAGAIVDQVLVDWIDVRYWQSYQAVNDQLLFGTPDANRYQLEVGGFSSPELILLDVTEPTTVMRLVDYTSTAAASGFVLSFELAAHPTKRYFVSTPAQIRRPQDIELTQPTAWQSADNGADYIIITHADFYESARRLAAHRQASGMRVAVVPVDELYDEFGNGLFDPTAIRNFLTHTFYYWQAPSPKYIVLFGDANQDYKDNLKSGSLNFVPSYNLISALFGEISSDNWFVDVSGSDGVPEMHVGRLAASSAQEAATIVDKIIRYDLTPPNADWKKKHLFVADSNKLFEPIAEQILSVQPQNYRSQRIYANQYDERKPTADIIDEMNQGSGLVTYVGHGNYQNWGFAGSKSGYMFGVSDIASLTNIDRLSIIAMGNCLNGFFAAADDKPSLAEALQISPSGGAVAVWAPSGLGYPRDHERLLEAFYSVLFSADTVTLGQAITSAKIALANQGDSKQELIDTYILFGDPATQMQNLSR